MSAKLVSLTTVAGKLLALDEAGALWAISLDEMNIVSATPRTGTWRRLPTRREEETPRE